MHKGTPVNLHCAASLTAAIICDAFLGAPDSSSISGRSLNAERCVLLAIAKVYLKRCLLPAETQTACGDGGVGWVTYSWCCEC